VATIYLSFPLTIAVLHNAGAALLVLLLTMLNYKAKYQYDIAKRQPQAPRILHVDGTALIKYPS
jgi:cytochrome c oxidase assembly protein subunit 15